MRDSAMRAAVIVRVPLEFLAGHHDRQGVLCAGLERLARDPASDDAAEAAALILDYLTNELPLHVADEEEDMMPALRRRCSGDDDLEGMLARLADEHGKDETLQACLPAVTATAGRRAGSGRCRALPARCRGLRRAATAPPRLGERRPAAAGAPAPDGA